MDAGRLTARRRLRHADPRGCHAGKPRPEAEPHPLAKIAERLRRGATFKFAGSKLNSVQRYGTCDVPIRRSHEAGIQVQFWAGSVQKFSFVCSVLSFKLHRLITTEILRRVF